ncbi:MAG TPA: SDR family NAD(P)-dependent oxidoreductase [Acidimicrobiales bacterium]|nr:SDR family NAD(P)-dependent oxidoreductase [Acidimicrobiales bacterium]
MAHTDTSRTAIVTGASRGFGLALTTDLAAAGWRVVIDGRDEDALRAAARRTGAVPVPGDVADPSHRADLVRAAVDLSGSLDLLVNNASTLGAAPLPRVADYPLGQLEDAFRVNVAAPVGLIQAALPLLRAAGGAVLNVTSDAAVEPYPGWGGYGSTKAALEQISRVLAAEEPGVRVWWFDPGDMRTRMHQEAFPGEDISDRPLPEAVSPTVLRLLQTRPPSGRVQAVRLAAESVG